MVAYHVRELEADGREHVERVVKFKVRAADV